MTQLPEATLKSLTEGLGELAGPADRSGAWPARSVELVRGYGACVWNVPEQYGGSPASQRHLLEIYEAVSAGCMSTSLICTQRDGAVELIATSPNEAVRKKYLPGLARGETHTTVGISQLTTSKRRGGHLMTAERDGAGYRLNGVMPWATGAEAADFIVTGGVTSENEQLLCVAATDADGVTVEAPDELLALTASRTSRVTCENVWVADEDLVRPPGPRSISMRTPVKPLVTSVCGLGLAGALQAEFEAAGKGSLEQFGDFVEPLRLKHQRIREQLYDSAERAEEPGFELPSHDLRVAVNDLLVRSAMAALTLSKGSGFIKGRATERRLREAMFFLVWSATTGVRIDTLEHLMRTFSTETAQES